MAPALTLLALLFEIAIGYPDRLLRAIGHPVTWMGSLVGALDHRLNRDSATSAGRRMPPQFTVAVNPAYTGADHCRESAKFSLCFC